MDRGGMRIARSTRACRLVVIADRMNTAEVVRGAMMADGA